MEPTVIQNSLSLPKIYQDTELYQIEPSSSVIRTILKKQNDIVDSQNFDPKVYFSTFNIRSLLDKGEESLEDVLNYELLHEDADSENMTECEFMSFSAMTRSVMPGSSN